MINIEELKKQFDELLNSLTKEDLIKWTQEYDFKLAKENLESLVDIMPKDHSYLDNIQTLKEILDKHNDFDYVECTIEITTRKKGKIISVYNRVLYSNWLNKIIDLPDDWDLDKLFYKQMLYCRIYLDKYEYPNHHSEKNLDNIEKGYLFICIDQATARKYPCKCLKECNFIDEYLGIKPYKHIYFYEPLREVFYIKAPEYMWITYLKYCPKCGTKIN